MGLFKRSFATTKDDDEDTTEHDLFSHSSSFHTILADKARRKRESLEKVGRNKERKNAKHTTKAEKSAVKTEIGEAEQSPAGESSKRRRITKEEGEKLLKLFGTSPDIPLELEDEDDDFSSPGQSMPIRKSPRLNKVTSRDDSLYSPVRPVSGLNNVQNVDDDDDEDVTILPDPQSSNGNPTTTAPDSEDDYEYDSDPEIASLERAAREQRKKEKLAASNSEGGLAGAESIDTASPALANEPSIKYFIDSPIDGTKPLLVYRKLSQRLQELREAWVKRQEIPQALKGKIFFVNELRKLYDVTTGLDLGLKVDSSGSIVKLGSEHMEGADQVHLVAVTDEEFTKLKKERAREERRNLYLSSQPEEEQSAAPEPKEREYKVQLRAKGLPEQRFKVRLSTSISKLEWVARDKFGVGKDATLWLQFDGECLDTNSTVEDTEIATMDDGDTITIDVFIR